MKLVCCILFMVYWIAFDAFAYTRDEKVAVAVDLVMSVVRARENSDCIDGPGTNVEFVAVTFPTYESLFARTPPEGQPGHGWSAAERRSAFEDFLAEVPTLAQTNLIPNLRFCVDKALMFADERNATNVLEFAKSILASPCKVGESRARHIFMSRVVPSLEMNAFVAMAVTNRLSDVAADYLADDYAAKLYKGIEDLDRSVVTNGTAALHRTLRGGYTARDLDKLYLRLYPDYATSSNRLDLASWALQNQDAHPSFYEKNVRDYFDPVTNRLLNASRPLVQLELP